MTWNDVVATPALVGGYLPIPRVEWAWDDQRLEVTVIPAGTPGHSALIGRYRLRNLGSEARRETLYLALRPFQVNPPTQFLNTVGGGAPIRELAQDGRVVRANGDRGLANGVNLRGYFAWSFMDNLEWASGFDLRFGLVHVDFATQQRTIKASGEFYREVIRTNGAALGA